MSKESVCTALTTILTSRFGMDKSLLGADSFDLMLTGDVLKFDKVTMVYLFCEVEKAFSIRIPQEMLGDYGFSTLNKIADVVLALQA